MLFRSKLLIFEEVHETAFILEYVLAVQRLTGQQVMSMMKSCRVELESKRSAFHNQLSFKTAELTLGFISSRVNVEVIAVTVRTCALRALEVIELIVVRLHNHEVSVSDVLSSLY